MYRYRRYATNLHAQVHVREPLLAIVGHRVPHAHLVELDRAPGRRLRARDLRPLRLPVVLGVESRGGPPFPAHQTEDRREDQTDNTESLRLVVVPWRFRGTFWRAKVLAARSSCARMVPVLVAGATGPRRPAWLFLVFIKYKASTLNIVPIYSVVTLCDDVRDLNANPCRAGRFLQGRRQNACLLVSYRTLALTLLGFGFV